MTDTERKKVMNTIIAHIAKGGTNVSACKKAGVTVETLWHWRQKGENDETKDQTYSKFLKTFTRACEIRRESLYDRLNTAGLDDWRAVEAYLKLDFAREQAREQTKPEGDTSPLTDEEKSIVDSI